MRENNYLIPANTKKGALILSIFTQADLMLFSIGIVCTLILLFIVPLDTLASAMVALSPALLASFLVLPMPNYHNVITLIKEVITYFIERRVYIWKGWCFYENFETEKK